MKKLVVTYNYCSCEKDAYNKAITVITDDYIQKFEVKTSVDYNEFSKKITATGKGFDLVLNFKDDHTLVTLDTSFVLRPFNKTILSKVKNKLEKHL